MKCLLPLVLIFCVIKVAESSGKLSIKFVKFYNPGSRTQNGGCCDNVRFCLSSCEIFVRFCLTLRSRSSACSLMNFETPVLGDDNFVFSNSLGKGISNPVVYSFSEWTEPFNTKISVLDDDGSNVINVGREADLISRHDLTISTPDTNGKSATKHSQILRGYRSQLTIEYRIFCDKGYFKPSCKELCVPTDNSTGHYTCDYDNSRRVCLPNWYGINCTHFCQPHDDVTGHYMCSSEGEKICRSNWYGSNCTLNCVPKDDGTGHYTCGRNGMKICLNNWFGEKCLKYCKSTDNYNCSEAGDKICSDRFYGVNCTNYCRANELGNFRCVNNKTIECTENFYGPNCSVYCASKSDASEGYSCSKDGIKICHGSWYGSNCDIHCQNTSTSYCTKNGTKLCHKNWYGSDCSRHCAAEISSPLRYYCDANGNVVCMPGWYGLKCSNFTGCIDDPTNSSHYVCDKQSGEKICHLGWTGLNCSQKMNASLSAWSSIFTSLTSSLTKQSFPATEMSHLTITPTSSTLLPSGQLATSSEGQTPAKPNVIQSSSFLFSFSPSASVLQHISLTSFKEMPSGLVSQSKQSYTLIAKPLTTTDKVTPSIFRSIAISTIQALNTESTTGTLTNGARATEILRNSEKTTASLEYAREMTKTLSISAKATADARNNVATTALLEELNTSLVARSKIERATEIHRNSDAKSIIAAINTTVSFSDVKSETITTKIRSSKETISKYRHSDTTTLLPHFTVEPAVKETVSTGKSSSDDRRSTSPVIHKLQSTFSKSYTTLPTPSLLRPSETLVNTVPSFTAQSSIVISRPNGEKASTLSKRAHSNIRIWLYVGVPLAVISLLITISMAKLKKHYSGRKSATKVKPIKIQSAFSDPEKANLLRSMKVADQSVSILPLIWTQLNKRESAPAANEVVHYY